MTQKDNVKQLIGKSLNTYNNKVLQQIDKIEKKNKQQNHKISMLTNELDNDYLTKSEEGSVISLDYSKEGMVYIDSLEGNTLVNYCTDGAKELTLNGDIDLEGINVTTTEGVDNGKVDVVCEGNTLVNLIKNSTWLDNNSSYISTEDVIYNPVGKTVTLFNLSDKKIEFAMNTDANLGIQGNYYSSVYVEPFSKDVINIPSGHGIRRIVGKYEHGWSGSDVDKVKDKVVLLDGNYSNINIPYFEGMKSVGQDDENGHKIEILSKNKNLFNPEEVYESSYSYGVPFVNSVKCQEEDGVFTTVTSANYWNSGIGFHVKTEKNKDYTLSVGEYFNDGVNMELRCIGVYKSEYPFKSNNNIQSYVNRTVCKELDSNNNSLTYNSKDYDYILFYIGGKWNENANGVKTFRMSKIEVNQSSTKPTNYTKQNLNKKEILLNEPLRSLPNGVKDRFVKIGGKLYIERNCGEININVPSSGDSIYIIQEDRCRIIMADYPSNILPNQNRNTVNLVCDKIPYVKQYDIDGTNPNYSYGITTRIDNAKGIYMWVTINKMPNQTLDGFKEFINNTQPKIIYQLETPIYEPLEIEPTLSCYSEVTHFSNNSIIPCNMKIQNSGYNAIIKPSTLYTVALDTNKSGTIGMNLGGVKGTTTNNVLTLTTPATLTDDSLRLYGKGIKGSKVRILEGDKTNWIPSHFEGMKSSFEDKFDVTDNTYKMEILSNNINLVDYENIGHKGIPTNEFAIKGDKITLNSSKTYRALYYHIPVKKGEDYIVSCKNITNGNVLIYATKVQGHHADKYKLSIGKNTVKARITPKSDYITLRVSVETMVNTDCTFEQLMIHRANVSSEFKFNKFNKIQFSSIEPLRRYKNSVDKFVFKDKKLMIERNCAIKIFNGSENWNYFSWINNNGRINRFELNVNTPSYSYQISNKYKYIWGDYPDTYYRTDNGTLFVYTQTSKTLSEFKQELKENNLILLGELTEPTYEEIPFELQKIILEGYENGTLFFDTNIPPTSTVTYAGETPIVKSVKLNKTEVLNNTNDINDNIVPYLMDMDYRVVCLELATETQGVSMARLFGGTYEMLQRDIQSKRYSIDEYRHRLDAYLSVNKITEKEYEELGEMLNE